MLLYKGKERRYKRVHIQKQADPIRPLSLSKGWPQGRNQGRGRGGERSGTIRDIIQGLPKGVTDCVHRVGGLSGVPAVD
jgi:hypothetical protein